MKIKSLILRNGKSVPIDKFTVLVGPNNVGKSQTLRDIYDQFDKGELAKTILIDSIEFDKQKAFESYFEGLDIKDSANSVGHKTVKGVLANLIEGAMFDIYPTNLQTTYDRQGPSAFFANIAKFKISYLDAGTRLRVAQKTQSFNPQTQFAQNLLQSVFQNIESEKALQEAFYETFQNKIKLDYSSLTEFAFKVAEEFGEIPEDPRKAFEPMSKFPSLDNQGDGYKSFVGVVLSLLLSKDRIVLLDEPEAFLHPAQARQLGYWIAEHSKSVPGQIIIATHNSSFLSGILSSNQNVNLFRLNRSNNETSFNLMGSKETISLVKSPLLSSQRVLDAIFHRGVIVCEADADRAVYQTVATKQLGVQEILFIHSHNKQSISTVTKLLHNVSIPVCAIADIDVVNDDCLLEIIKSIGNETNYQAIEALQKDIIYAIQNSDENKALTNLKARIDEFSFQLESKEHTLSGARGALNRLRKETSNWTTLKSEGMAGVSEHIQEKLREIIELAKLNHLFIVPVGELEKWMELESSQKNKWIILALDELFNDNCPQNLKEFIEEVIGDLKKG